MVKVIVAAVVIWAIGIIWFVREMKNAPARCDKCGQLIPKGVIHFCSPVKKEEK